ncbi:MAG TPA: alpha/beta hydrolase [Bryobacteraceae bacterium]|nr:alpha/beta hydrolase [Bryobacteraceae bacterium]
MSDPVVVSVREPGTESGGPIVPAREEGGHLDGFTNLLILVHGYNNSRTVAQDSYGTFLNDLKKVFATLTAQVAEFQWPGDEPNQILSTLSYANQVPHAIASAAEFEKYLAGLRHSGPLVLNFVAHSLGCRLVLEILKKWAANGLPPNVSIGVVVLMAAAVVVKQVDSGGALERAAQLTAKNPVLYSKGDMVLHFAFPLGETAAGEGFFPVAVGRTGGPPGVWHAPLAMSHNGNAYAHGSYWPGTESAAAVASALGGAPARFTPENALIVKELPAASETPIRALTARNLLSRPAFA